MLPTFIISRPLMASVKIVEGVFAVNKPKGISSAQALRELQQYFNPSNLFRPWIEAERNRRELESHNQRRRRRNTRAKEVEVKIGHGGTLDPLATGVLIAGVGKGTKSLQNFLECTKTYEAVVLFGVATDTYDSLGRIVNNAPYDHITRDGVEKALDAFKGKIMQKPPIYSALKMQGRKLYEYARRGEAPPTEIQERPVEVLNLEIVEWLEGGSHEYTWPRTDADTREEKIINDVLSLPQAEQDALDLTGVTNTEVTNTEVTKRKFSRETTPEGHPTVDETPTKKIKNLDDAAISADNPHTTSEQTGTARGTDPSQDAVQQANQEKPPAAKLRMTVTSGFYVRSLCNDLGRAMNSFAIMSELVRSRQGDFEIGRNVLEFEEFQNGEDVWGPKVEEYLDKWNSMTGKEGRVRGLGSPREVDKTSVDGTILNT